ncbi:unnamed protein product [Alopecurus aequalis]
MGSGSLLKVLAKNFDVLAGPLVALAYPLYASVRAIETKSTVDDQQWLTYWVLYSLITLFELTFASIIECGAAYVYQKYVRPVFVKNQMVNIWYVPQKKGLFGKSDDFLKALDKYIAENGPEALKKLTDKAGKSSKQSGKLWKGLKESKSSKESKEPKASKDTKDSKSSKDSKPAKDSKEQKKVQKDSPEQKKALRDSKELKKSLKDWKQLKKSLKDPKEPAPSKDSDEPEPKKSSKRVTFAEVEPEKAFKASNSDWHPTSDYHSAYPDHNSWNSSFMIFDDEHGYWN